MDPLCAKIRQHSEFIGVNDFKCQDLPKDIQNLSFYVWLRNCIPLVVRINCQHGIVATGRAILIPHKRLDKKICQDYECRYRETLGSEHEIYGGIGIITNKHVVKNNIEAQNTTIEFFFHDNENRNYTIIQDRGSEIYSTNNNFDYTVFTSYTHRKDLFDIIELLEKIRTHVWQRIPKQIRENSRFYAIIISHPHGTFKKVSIGNVLGRVHRGLTIDAAKNVIILRDLYNICDEVGGLTRFAEYFRQVPDFHVVFTITTYSTATCKGSSGAPVFMGDVVNENGVEINQAHTHRGTDHNTGHNMCYT